MPVTQSREIAAATRLDNVRYAIRDLAAIAEDLAVQGHKILPLNIGDSCSVSRMIAWVASFVYAMWQGTWSVVIASVSNENG